MYQETNGASKLLSNKKDKNLFLCLGRRKATLPKKSIINEQCKKERKKNKDVFIFAGFPVDHNC